MVQTPSATSQARGWRSLLQRVRRLAPTRLIRFLCVGMAGLAVDQASLAIFDQAGLPFYIARAAAIAVATGVTWQLNRRFTFANTGRAAHHEAGRYFAVAALAQSVNYGVSLFVNAQAPHWPHALAAFIGAVAATTFSYSGQRYFTFAPKTRPTGPDAEHTPGLTPPDAP